jgi:hypothetical protein
MTTKEGATVSVHPVEASPAAIEEAALTATERRIRQAVWTIVAGVALPCIPIIVITIVLLYFIFHYQVHVSSGWEELQAPVNKTQEDLLSLISLVKHQGGDTAYYVNFNPSTITTIAVSISTKFESAMF